MAQLTMAAGNGSARDVHTVRAQFTFTLTAMTTAAPQSGHKSANSFDGNPSQGRAQRETQVQAKSEPRGLGVGQRREEKAEGTRRAQFAGKF